MERKNEQLTLRIAELKKAVRRKYRQFKDGVVETERLLERQYRPIIKELRKVDPKAEVKSEPESVHEQESLNYESDDDDNYIGRAFIPEKVSTPKPNDELVAETSEPELSEIVSTSQGLETASQFVTDHFKNPLTQKYMNKFMKDWGGKKQTIDHDYGPKYDGNILKVGDQPLTFDDDGTIIIGNIRYNASEGLYELLFKRIPDDEIYTKSDLQTYKSILYNTNAHKKNNKFHGSIKRNRSLKYRLIIQSLFPPKGKGLGWKSNRSRDIVHWDDPNELVDRLSLLVMSTESGNTSHRNEILNIVEELREAGYIKGVGNDRYRSLVR